jgi:hypothetical protein
VLGAKLLLGAWLPPKDALGALLALTAKLALPWKLATREKTAELT